MIDNENLLPEADIQQKAREFLLMEYPTSKATFNSAQLVDKENNRVFQLAGIIEMKSRGTMDHFIFRPHPNQFSFNMELDARWGTVLNYELR